MSWKVSKTTRDKLPDSAFMLPSQRKYPYKKRINGVLKPTAQGLRAVISRANANGDTAISKRASAMLAKLNKK